MTGIDFKLDNWKKQLLDLGKRNRLINYRETKRSNLNITLPDYVELFKEIVVDEKTLIFPYPMDKRFVDDDDVEEIRTEIIDGDLETDRTIKDQQKTLKALREKAKTAMEEQGVNILYLSFGFLNWRESTDSSQTLVSPIMLVPVSITIESITDPYKLSLHEDEIVINPTLAHKLENDFGLNLPEFDLQNDNIESYLMQISKLVEKSGWEVDTKVSLSLLSFLKINMYYDLERHSDAIKGHAIIKALCGDDSEIAHIPEEMNDYNHDTNERPIDIYQVVDADSSQQDAIVLSKKGVSFVLQGPPGTGKSQTITNIISEALADGKKVLFVSEKMAALEVVHRRLSTAGLADFCLILHSHKANKKEILKTLSDTLNLDHVSIREDAIYQLEVLKNERDKLNEYSNQLHTRILPLNRTIYEANGVLAKLTCAPDVIFTLESVELTTPEQLRKYIYLISEFTKTVEKMSEDYDSNSWKGCTVKQVTHELRHDIEAYLRKIKPQLPEIITKIENGLYELSIENNLAFDRLSSFAQFLSFCSTSPKVPTEWLADNDLNVLFDKANNFNVKMKERLALSNELSASYTSEILNSNVERISLQLSDCFEDIFCIINDYYHTEKSIFDNANCLALLCQKAKVSIENLVSAAGVITKGLHLKELSTISEIEELYSFAINFVQNISPAECWFVINNKKTRLDLLAQANEFQVTINLLSREILECYEEKILNVYYSDILMRFRTDYTSAFKISNEAYELDRNEIRALRIDPVDKIDDCEIVNALGKLKILHEKQDWLKEQDALLKESRQILSQADEAHITINLLKSEILKKYKEEILGISYSSMLIRFETGYTSIFKIFNKTYKQDCNEIRGFCITPARKITDSEIIDVLEKLKILCEKQDWLRKQDAQIRESKNLLAQADEVLITINTLCSEILGSYEKEIINADYSDMMRRYRIDYTPTFKITHEAYKCDCSEIRTLHSVPIENIEDSEIINILCKLKTLHEKEDWFLAHDVLLRENLGGLYVGEHTNYDDVEKAFALFERITDYFGGAIPQSIKQLLLSGHNYQMYSSELEEINKILSTDIINEYQSILSNMQSVKSSPLTTVLEHNMKLTRLLSDCTEIMQPIILASISSNEYDFHKESLAKFARLQEIQSDIEAHSDTLKYEYQFLYNGIDTNWEQIMSALIWTIKFKGYIVRDNLTIEFQHKIATSDRAIVTAAQLADFIESAQKQLSADINWFNELFDEDHSIEKLTLYALQDKVQNCLNNLAGLEEWIDFRSARQNCEAEGLSEFINIVLEERINKSLILDAFNKRFNRLWLDSVLPNYPAVYAFRSRNQEETIKCFSELDKTQMQIARLRIREKLIANLPDVNRITSAVDEVGILKRELSKQKRIMPIRKLFAKIPTLLPCLKPCLMMSPLSVSLFLQSDSYNFDMVIFDEASQVCTENAIGAIMRAKQIVIAGDSKQLPPTNFFNASISDADFDIDDEDELDEAAAYESVLDEAVTVLPERSLKWHYRSRHEDLIAFSNAKIYHNSLITFPSHIGRLPDNGVEYIYVEDGVYDRSGKKHNINEAKMVARIVIEQMIAHPKRSLGVITFSESQQQAVDSAMRQIRIQNPQFEEFFSENKDEAFFIKNLENVQGDERDTIIFSIGYAKDANGVMYMNFGPLSRDGGYRRLNVAITRAKYNIKLIGSIHPTDIRLEGTNAEGVKMLRSYIEFAINGTSSLANEVTYDKVVNVESPFEESVYDFLVSKGYRIATQVGCSGYRIDLAVKHPALDGRFVLGIECDGATYHSSRTARERDRLRQDVLEDIGWRMFRIWSTDWIKDPVTEGKKLVDAVEKAIAEYTVDTLVIYKADTLKKEAIADKYLIVEKNSCNRNAEQTDNDFGFEYYMEADIREIDRDPNDLVYLCNAIEHVVKIEYPIHFELLCKRLASLFGNQKATVKVRREIEFALKRMPERIIYANDYLYPVNFCEIIPRIPADGEIPRSINNICVEELSEAMLKIISKSYGIVKENLFQLTAREFGFNRTGANIVSALDEACVFLQCSGKVQLIEEKFSLTK